MKKLFLTSGLVLLVALTVFGQGQFLFLNARVPTRLWSIDGPLAGPGIWAHMLAGPLPESLVPVGTAHRHFSDDGIIAAGTITLPNIPIGGVAYVQMVAWDGRLWGTVLEAVPADQLGRTDIARTILGGFPFPVGAPPFTRPAIVPIPEPASLPLASSALVLLFLLRWRRRRRGLDIGA
jgi:hypothetical protein